MTMIEGSWKAFVQPSPGRDSMQVWLVKHVGNEVYNTTIQENGELLMTHHNAGEVTKPLMELPRTAWKEVLDAFMEYQKPTPVSVLEKEMEATKYHLEDMRTLIFGPKPIINIDLLKAK